jgi:hypothetical protein
MGSSGEGLAATSPSSTSPLPDSDEPLEENRPPSPLFFTNKNLVIGFAPQKNLSHEGVRRHTKNAGKARLKAIQGCALRVASRAFVVIFSILRISHG